MNNLTSTTPGIMMTLAALAATAPVERPSGETLVQQAERIMEGITNQLTDPSLATAAEWNLVWLGLSQDRANFAFIAQNTQQNSFAVCLRGTVFSSLIDLGEDLNAGSVVEFTAAYTPSQTSPLLVSKGAMEAFTEITSAVYPFPHVLFLSGTTLLEALQSMLDRAEPNPILYITGHSLGGAMATMVGLYLAACDLPKNPPIAVYTFAAPTAGLQAFADYYDLMLTNSDKNEGWRIYNTWDAVPNAWASLGFIDSFYPDAIGPVANLQVEDLLGIFAQFPGNNQYVQTNQNNVGLIELNYNYSSYDGNFVCATLDDFLGQVGYQHNSYLELLGVPLLPYTAPTVESVSPNCGSVAVATWVNIVGTGFAGEGFGGLYVDFGTLPAVMVTVESPTQIRALAPPLVGTVDVRVTNSYGTSPVTASDQYTAPPPALVPEVTAIIPNCGPSNVSVPVQILGAGFTTDSTVSIGGTLVSADQITWVSLTEILAYTPTDITGTAPVIVTNSIGPSTSDISYTIGTPVVFSVTPCSGPTGKTGNIPIVIKGAGFSESDTVSFGGVSATVLSCPTSGELRVTAPVYDTAGTVDVTVTNAAGESATYTADQYSYYLYASKKDK